MAAKLTRLTHKIAIQLQLVAERERAIPFAVLAPGDQSGSFWIHPRTLIPYSCRDYKPYVWWYQQGVMPNFIVVCLFR